MASHAGLSVQSVENKIANFDYSTHELATYLVLIHRKELLGARNFRIWGMNIDKVNVEHVDLSNLIPHMQFVLIIYLFLMGYMTRI